MATLAPAATTPALAHAADKMAANMILPGEPLLFYTVSPPPVLASNLQSSPAAAMFPFMTSAPGMNGMALAPQYIPVSWSHARMLCFCFMHFEMPSLRRIFYRHFIIEGMSYTCSVFLKK